MNAKVITHGASLAMAAVEIGTHHMDLSPAWRKGLRTATGVGHLALSIWHVGEAVNELRTGGQDQRTQTLLSLNLAIAVSKLIISILKAATEIVELSLDEKDPQYEQKLATAQHFHKGFSYIHGALSLANLALDMGCATANSQEMKEAKRLESRRRSRLVR